MIASYYSKGCNSKELFSNLDFDECRRWYDGYKLNNKVSIYNPKSMVSAMLSVEFGNFWTKTGSYEALSNYVLMDFDGIKDDVFTYLIHLGYLSYE